MLEARHTAGAKRYKYLRRILMFRQMDFEFALWQMLYLCVAPQRVYRNFHYRKQTKDQWARDDPAFLVLLSFWLCASSLGFAIVLQLSILGMIKLLLWVIFVDCIGVGLMVATLLWFVANKYLQTQKSDQEVEWGYAFDVHLNAFFPLLIILHVIQLFFIHPLIDKEWFMSRLFGNTLWLIALGYYLYITFLGYSSLPFLRHTVVLLYPAMLIILTFYIISLPVGWNFTQGLMWFYRYRVGHYV